MAYHCSFPTVLVRIWTLLYRVQIKPPFIVPGIYIYILIHLVKLRDYFKLRIKKGCHFMSWSIIFTWNTYFNCYNSNALCKEVLTDVTVGEKAGTETLINDGKQDSNISAWFAQQNKHVIPPGSMIMIPPNPFTYPPVWCQHTLSSLLNKLHVC